MKKYHQFLNESLNPYVGFYTVDSIDEVLNDLINKNVEYEYDKEKDLLIIEKDIVLAYNIVTENGGKIDHEWLKYGDSGPSNGVLLRSKPFTVPKGAYM